MKVLWSAAVIGLGLIGSVAAQPYGGYDDGYGGRGPRSRDYEYRDRGYDRGYGDRGPRERGYGGAAFDEREYLRCNPDVRRAVNNGTMPSAALHYQRFGRREGRRLSC